MSEEFSGKNVNKNEEFTQLRCWYFLPKTNGVKLIHFQAVPFRYVK
jgi:hypothetical protein